MKAEGQQNCAKNAIEKARDSTEAFRIDRNAVKVITGARDQISNEDGSEGRRISHRVFDSSYEEGSTVAFSGEEIKITSSVTVNFVANSS